MMLQLASIFLFFVLLLVGDVSTADTGSDILFIFFIFLKRWKLNYKKSFLKSIVVCTLLKKEQVEVLNGGGTHPGGGFVELDFSCVSFFVFGPVPFFSGDVRKRGSF